MNRALYIAYLTGAVGQSVGMFYIGENIIAGIDITGMNYDGNYKIETDGSLTGIIEFTIPPSGRLITGMSSGSTPVKIPVQLRLPKNFDDGQIITFQTPVGPVNARFEKKKEF